MKASVKKLIPFLRGIASHRSEEKTMARGRTCLDKISETHGRLARTRS